jgi:hypothetical protein
VATIIVLSAWIVRTWGERVYAGTLLVLFPVHGLAFGWLAWRKRQPRYVLLVATFAILTMLAYLRWHEVPTNALTYSLRACAITCTLVSLAWMVRDARRKR